MRHRPLLGDLVALRDGLSVGWAFGLGSLEELTRSAYGLETGIYRRGSLYRTPTGLGVPLLNPPLRIGAFRAVRLFHDGKELPAERCRAATDGAPTWRTLAELSDRQPLELANGEGSRYELDLGGPAEATSHQVRIEWCSVAVPPTVWMEIRDTLPVPTA